MNIEIANRLVNLRKEKNLSQEALAEKLGISRQAVSKWERAEASPDTDNLIMLARLYGISLDELLQTEDEIPRPDIEETEQAEQNTSRESASAADNNYDYYKNNEYVHVGVRGVHVKDKDGSEVHVGWNGIHVDDKKSRDNVHIDKNGVYVNGRQYKKEDWKYYHEAYQFPIDMIIVLLYILIGFFYNMWGTGLLLFLLIPLIHSTISMIRHKDPNRFAYPVFVTGVFLLLGFYKNMWHPGWVVFLTIPIYYSMAAYFHTIIRRNSDKREETKSNIQ